MRNGVAIQTSNYDWDNVYQLTSLSSPYVITNVKTTGRIQPLPCIYYTFDFSPGKRKTADSYQSKMATTNLLQSQPSFCMDSACCQTEVVEPVLPNAVEPLPVSDS
jgi:hypothetical protein